MESKRPHIEFSPAVNAKLSEVRQAVALYRKLDEHQVERKLIGALINLLEALDDEEISINDLISELTEIAEEEDIKPDKVLLILVATQDHHLNKLKGVRGKGESHADPKIMLAVFKDMDRLPPSQKNQDIVARKLAEILKKPDANIETAAMLPLLMIRAKNTDFEDIILRCFLHAQYMAIREYVAARKNFQRATLDLGQTPFFVNRVISE